LSSQGISGREQRVVPVLHTCLSYSFSEMSG
jgi:hypothetical protein